MPGLIGPFALPVLLFIAPQVVTAAAETVGLTDLEQEAGEAVVVAAALADLPAAVEDRARDAGDGAADLLGGGRRERCVPGGAERRSIRPIAQQVGGAPGLADLAAGSRDAAGLGQRGDEGALPLGRPAVAARAHGDGCEG